MICRLQALSDPRVRGVFKDWRDEIAKRSLRQADAAWIALARVLSWALDRRKIAANPCERGGRLYHGTRADKVWTLEQETAFLAVASEPLRRAYVLAIWTGQMQGDLLRLPWSAWDQTPLPKAPHGRIRLRQGKTGVGRRDHGVRTAQRYARCRAASLAGYTSQFGWEAMDLAWLLIVVAQGVQEGGHRRHHLQ